MKKSIIISIPEPCHENWAAMTPTEKGKFCGVCTKEVIDFTTTSDEEIVKKVTGGTKICGRFKKSQLDREVTMERASKFKLMPYAASLLMPLTLLSSTTSAANSDNSAFNKPAISLGIGSNTDKSIVEISGVITDIHGNPIAQAEVIVVETGVSVWSQNDGSYSLKCVSGSTLVFQKEYMKPHQVTVGTKHAVVQVLLEQDSLPEIEILGEIAIPEDLTPILQGRIGKFITIDKQELSEQKKDSAAITISGTITDENGLALPGVNIIEQGTSNGIATDFDGNYSFEINSNAVLIYSYLGYSTEEINSSNITNEISFQMQPSDDMLQGEMIICRFPIAKDYYPDPLSRTAELDSDQKAKQSERNAYAQKVNAFLKVQQERAKARRAARRKKK